MLCDTRIEYSIDTPDGRTVGIGRASRTPPPWLRRRVDRPRQPLLPLARLHPPHPPRPPHAALDQARSHQRLQSDRRLLAPPPPPPRRRLERHRQRRHRDHPHQPPRPHHRIQSRPSRGVRLGSQRGTSTVEHMPATTAPAVPRSGWRRRLVQGFVVAVLATQLGFALNGYREPHKFFAFQPFNESSTWKADIVRVTWGGERMLDRGWLGGLRVGRARRHVRAARTFPAPPRLHGRGRHGRLPRRRSRLGRHATHRPTTRPATSRPP